MYRAVFALLVTTAAYGATPPEQLVQEIADLREQVGEQGQVLADPAGFAQALQNVATRDRGAPARASDQPRISPIEPARPPATAYETRPQFQQRVVPGGWGHAMAPDPPPALRVDRSPRAKLRESAFELDRIAHELELAERCDEADEVRRVAAVLRKSARKIPPVVVGGVIPGPRPANGSYRAIPHGPPTLHQPPPGVHGGPAVPVGSGLRPPTDPRAADRE